MKWYWIWLCLGLAACRTREARRLPEVQPAFVPGPRVLVYKTREDYHHLVPVSLTEDRQAIASFPHPRDVQDTTSGPPLALRDGYWLDRRGIGPTVAFLDIDYDTYAALTTAPNPDTLLGRVLDADPLLELCDCGHRQAFQDLEGQLNDLIARGRLRTVCKVLR